jgi:hypothetical protein
VESDLLMENLPFSLTVKAARLLAAVIRNSMAGGKILKTKYIIP